jgi:uncharacterized RDD family membrane protein YckC
VSQLVTGEAVALDLRTAGVPSRILAALVDVALQGLLAFGLLLLVGVASSSEATFAALSVTALVLVGLGYPVLLETLLAGRTPGKLVLGLRVVRDDGGPIAFRQAFVRGLIGLFVEKPGISAGSAALITSLLNQDGKRLGDLAAGTLVVQERVARASTDVVPMPAGLAGWATTLDLSALSDATVMTVRGFLSRHDRLTEATRASLGSRLVEEVTAAVGPPPPGVPPGAFLSAVVAERRQRAERTVAAETPLPPVVAPPPPAAAADSPFAPPS